MSTNDAPANNTRNFNSRRKSATEATVTATAGSSHTGDESSTMSATNNAPSPSPSKAQKCAQQRAEAEEVVNRAGVVREAVVKEILSPAITEGELQTERDNLVTLVDEVEAVSITALTPKLRAHWAEALKTRAVELRVLISMLESRLGSGGSGGGGPAPLSSTHTSQSGSTTIGASTSAGVPTSTPPSATATATTSAGAPTAVAASVAATTTSPATTTTTNTSTIAGASGQPQMRVTSAQQVGAGGPALIASQSTSTTPTWSGQSTISSGQSSLACQSCGQGSASAAIGPQGAALGGAFVPNQCHLGDAFYLSLPPPWDVVPQKTGTSTNELVKMAMNTLPKFDGDKSGYLEWRGGFISCVHVAQVNIQYKIMLLRNSIKPDTTELKELLKSFVYSPEGYKQAVTELEEMYGGEEARLLVRQEAILSLPGLKEGDYKNLLAMRTRLGTYLLEGQALGSGNAESLGLFAAIMGKIDKVFGLKYCRWVEEGARRKGLQSLLLWLKEQVAHHRAMEQYAVKTTKTAQTSESKWKTQRNPTTNRFQYRTVQSALVGEVESSGATTRPPENKTAEKSKPKLNCTLCSASHPLAKCPKFRTMSPSQRKSFLAEERRCFRCFQRTHLANKCNLAVKCKVCDGRHHSMLHTDANVSLTLKNEVEEVEDEEGALSETEFGLLTTTGARVSLRTLVVWVENPRNGRGEYVNALLDDGCTGAVMVAEDLAEVLDLTGDPVVARTEGVGGHVMEYNTIVTPLTVRAATGGSRHLVPGQVMKLPAGHYQPVDWQKCSKRFPHLKPLALGSPKKGGVRLLIGNKYPALTLALREVVGGPNDPVARLTPLGWTVVGPTTPGGTNVGEVAVLVQSGPEVAPLPQGGKAEEDWRVKFSEKEGRRRRSLPSDRALVRLVKRMLEVEMPAETQVLSPQEEYAIKSLRASLCLDDGRYQAQCLWLPGGGRPTLGMEAALRRLRSLERSHYFRDPAVKEAYAQVFKLWDREGFIKEVPQGSEQVKNLIPHFPIVKDSASTPVRPVMDCAVTLNDYILPGPNLLNDVNAVLLRFRSGLVAFSGDVKQMFLRIWLDPADRPYHCFLWRDEPSAPLKVYQFRVHVFGNAGSPCVAVYVVKEHAKKYKKLYPKAVEAIHHSTLIDDVLDSSDSVEEATTILSQTRLIFSQAGMKMTKFYSSHPQVLGAVPREDWAKGLLDVAEACHRDVDPAPIKALGMQYDPQDDCFRFAPPKFKEETWSKRKMLKTFPQVWDPLGLVLPYTMNARLSFSEVARRVSDWDQVVEPSTKWSSWLKDLPNLSKITFPRCLKKEAGGEFALHIFADASRDAYASAGYLVSLPTAGERTARLVMAKGHVSPPKPLTIPRLELMGTHLAAKLKIDVINKLKMNVLEVHLWTDSTTVLYWLHNDKTRFQQFVANKLSKIRDLIPLANCHWVPTHLNPADLPSRGVSLSKLQSSSLWQEGPPFLITGDWPQQPPIAPSSAVLAELRKEDRLFVAVETTPVVPLHRWSSWMKAIRITKRIAEWYLRARKSGGGELPTQPADLAEKWLLKQIQLRSRQVWEASPTKATCRAEGWTQMPLRLDEDGLLRGRGRLAASQVLPRDVREPLLLDKRHVGTKLLVRHLHESGLHYGGVNYTLSRLNGRFWLPGARVLIKQIVQACVRCRRKKLELCQVPEGPLPDWRLPAAEGGAPFAVTGVDCAGPFKVKIRRSHEPYYLVLFTCCHIRAVRLEWMSALSVDAFLMALTRAASRGVNPHTVLSDNGRNFVGTNELLKFWLTEEASEELRARRPAIRWIFNPPYASHCGGVFERLIKAAKEALRHAIPDHCGVTLEQLSTAFYVVEGVLNRRPLSYAGDELTDPQPLTPNHFLYGAASTPLWNLLTGEKGGHLHKKWKQLEEMTNKFYVRFHEEIVPYLAATRKTKGGRSRELAVGDVVAFFLPSSDSKWPLGRIAEVHPGRDGVVRNVLIRMATTAADNDGPWKNRIKTFKRHARQVALILPTEGGHQQL